MQEMSQEVPAGISCFILWSSIQQNTAKLDMIEIMLLFADKYVLYIYF